MYKDKDGIYYKSKLHKAFGIASPSLNYAHGGMKAVWRKACENAARIATVVE